MFIKNKNLLFISLSFATSLNANNVSSNTNIVIDYDYNFISVNGTLNSVASTRLGIITTNTNNQGVINLSHDSEIVDSVGTSSLNISTLNINSNITDLSSTAYVNNVNISNSSGATFNLLSSAVLDSNLITNGGIINLNNGSDIFLVNQINNNGTINFSDTNFSGTLNMNSGSTSSGNILLSSSGTININNIYSGMATINGQSSGQGVVNLNTTQTLNTAIGTTNSVSQVNLNSSQITLNTNIKATNVNIDNTSTLNTINSNITGNVVNNGNLNINGTGTISGNISGTGNIDLYNDYSANGSFSTNNLNVRADSTLTSNVSSSSISGTTTLNGHSAKIVTNQNLNLNSLEINANNNYYDFGINKVNTMIDASAGDLTVTSITGPADTDLVYFTTTTVSDANSSEKVEVVMNYQPSEYNSFDKNNLKTYFGAQDIIYSDKTIFNEMNSLDIDGIKDSLSTMNPESQGVLELSTSFVTHSLNLISTHLSSLNNNKLNVGISTGDISLNNLVWGKTYYTKISQDDDGTISGYDGLGYGFIAGFDRIINDNQVYGISLGLAKGKVDSKNTLTKAQTDTNSFQISLYGTQTFKKFQLEEMLSYSYNMNKSQRNIVIGSIANQAKADYNSQQFTFRAGISSTPFYIADWFIITPKTSISVAYLKTDSYSETGTGMLLNVDTEDFIKYTPKINIDFREEILTNHGTYIPYLNLGYGYELGDEYTVTNSTFQGAGSSFETVMLNGSKEIFESGLGLSYISKSGLSEFSLDFNSIFKDGYNEQTGMFTSKFKF